MEQEFNFQQTIIEFNQDSRVIELRDRYSAKSFLEIMSVERSENRHSSFLAWLLGAKDFAVNPKDHPIVHLLDILIRRMGEQENENVQNQFEALKNLKDTILSRDIKDIKVDVDTEKTIKDVTTNKAEYGTIRDRLDLYITVFLTTQSNKQEEFEIIVENKVCSTEGLPKTKDEKEDWKGEYATMYQTKRYYKSCHNSNRIFVFLTPISDSELDDFKNISDVNKKSQDSHFININYQDILDEIIEPLLVNNNLSDRIHVLLEEYALSLALPGESIEDDSKDAKDIVKSEIIMAVRKRDTYCISQILKTKKYRELIVNSLGQTTSKDGNQSSLLYKFGLTYKKLFTAMLKTYIENYNYNTDEEDIDELIGIYQKSLGNAKPRDLSKFSITDSNGNQLLKPIGKGKFAEFVIRRYIKYWSINHDAVEKLPAEYFQLAKTFNALYKADSLEEKQEKRYYKEKEEGFYISTQWGIAENKEGSFDLLFEKMFSKKFQDMENGQEYTTNEDLQLESPWDKIFNDCTIKVKKIVR